MSRESYSVGFCKAAMASGVDPLALAEIALFIKRASSSQPSPAPEPEVAAPTAVPEKRISFGDDISNWWNGLEEWQRSLIGVGGGALLGGAIQKMLGGEAGGTGAVLGGLGGLAATGVDWNALSRTFGNGGGAQNADKPKDKSKAAPPVKK